MRVFPAGLKVKPRKPDVGLGKNVRMWISEADSYVSDSPNWMDGGALP